MTPGTEEPPTEMGALADRCEQATGPDREIDCTIGRAIGFRPDDPDSMQTSCPWAFSPSYTASIDAAMTLIPDNMGWTHWSPIGKRPCVSIQTDAGYGIYHGGTTLALALCAAALRARAHLQATSDSKDAGR